ncbi:hypothetical protein RhiirA1_404424, partial [Rhizophagus irregularis]
VPAFRFNENILYLYMISGMLLNQMVEVWKKLFKMKKEIAVIASMNKQFEQSAKYRNVFSAKYYNKCKKKPNFLTTLKTLFTFRNLERKVQDAAGLHFEGINLRSKK